MLKKRVPIFRKVSNMLRISIFVSKMRKPGIPKLVFLKKSRKLKRLLLLNKKYHKYNKYNRFLQDYEFSPSTTPLIHCHKQIELKNYKGNIQSMLFMYRCLPGFIRRGQVALPLETVSVTNPEGECLQPLDLWDDDEEESVDQRAERFIEKFYHQMRMQRQQSI